jgi:hypothetical protein
MGRTPRIFVGVFLFVSTSIANCRADNPVYQTLLTRGVPVGGNEVVKLPAPTLADGLSAADQRRAIEAIAGESHTWEDLTRKSVVAPFVLKISNGEGSSESRGRRLDIWFVAYGSIKTLYNQEFLKKHFKSATSVGYP